MMTQQEEEELEDYLVALEAAWLVRDVDSVEDAVSIAVSEVGKKLTDAGLDYVEIQSGVTVCPACKTGFESAFVAADTGLVGVVLELKVYNAEGEEHAERIAKSTVGRALSGVSLEVLEVEPL